MFDLLDYLDTIATLPAGPLAAISVAGSFVGGFALFAAIIGVSCLVERADNSRR